MLATYSINNELNGIEVIFSEKPSEEIRDNLKRNGFRWHRQKKLWYAKNNENRLDYIKTICKGEIPETEELGGTVSDGYMGAKRWDGNKSHLHLYGSDLSKAIREDLKKHGIKGCTVSVDTYSMGQSITVKVKVSDDDFKPYDEWKQERNIFDFANHGWIWKNEEHDDMYADDFCKLSNAEQEKVFEINAKRAYQAERDYTINHYHLDNYTTFNPALMQKIQNVIDCVNSYRYDDSNSMVDYFDTNFYYDIELKEMA